ncbi:hypothetical protein CCACVL1_30859 [Corchorus capsularis]|uniref:Uncharacterized protein n=1 Tax=Corchorus capsularis TaxID=210143 RepID=A0A1R3FVA5_COCAP|nr:hypothetical protein CCACVL1_30859 [Corchorus capsularis]
MFFSYCWLLYHVIHQLTEELGSLEQIGGTAFNTMVVGYNNVDVNAANKMVLQLGVLTEITAELAGSLSLAAAGRTVEADVFMRVGLYDGWLPHLLCFKVVYLQVPIPLFDLAVQEEGDNIKSRFPILYQVEIVVG